MGACDEGTVSPLKSCGFIVPSFQIVNIFVVRKTSWGCEVDRNVKALGDLPPSLMT